MRILTKTRTTTTLEVTKTELEILNNALNEVCHGLDIQEFATRMGAEKGEVLKVLHRVAEALA